MRQLYTYLLVVILMTVCSHKCFSFELRHKVCFQYSKVKTEVKTIQGETFTSVDYDGFVKSDDIGDAKLPFEVLEFEVPSNSHSFSISSTVGIERDIPLMHAVEVSQEPVLSSGSITEQKLIVSYASLSFPDAYAKIVQDGYYNGDIHMLYVAVYPFKYDALSGKLTFIESIEFTINDSFGIQPMSLDVQHFKSSIRPLQNTDTGSCAPLNSAIDNYALTPLVGNGLPAYEYAVITSRKLARAFDKIIGLKKQKGLDAGVVCIEDILADTAFDEGDTISHIKDDAGKLRAYLMASRRVRKGDMFVLLGGNKDIVPVRLAYDSTYWTNKAYKIFYGPDGNKSDKKHPYSYKLPTDWYYSDLNGNWDGNRNGRYGEENEKNVMDFIPDIYVGRICCKNEAEVYNYEYKLLKYEMNPGNGDFSYLRNLLSLHADDMQADNEAGISADRMKPIIENKTIFEESPSYDDERPIAPYASDIINEINKTNYGFINLHAHGGVVASTVKSQGCNIDGRYCIVSQQKVPRNYSWARDEEVHGLDKLTNFNFPAIGYSMGCDLMPFDNMLVNVHSGYLKESEIEITIPEEYYNFGDSFTIGGHYGGPIFIGNTRFGLIPYSFYQELNFLSKLLNDGCLGRVRAKTQSSFTSDHHCRLTNNLLGCPELKMWIKTPRFVEYSEGNLVGNNSKMVICDADIKASIIDLERGIVRVCNGSISNEIQTLYVPGQNFVVTLTGDYRIPKRMPLHIDNILIKADGYYFVSDIKANRGGDNARIKFNNAKVSFDAQGDIDIKQPLIVDKGSDVTFVATGTSTFGTIEIKNGSKLTIDSNGYRLEGECLCELGSELIIK